MAAEAGGGGDGAPSRTWDAWKDGNTNRLLPAAREGTKARLHQLAADQKSLPPGVDAKEQTKYKYQLPTGNAKVDKARNSLVDDYNAIADKRLKILVKLQIPQADTKVTQADVREVVKMALNAKKRYDQLKAENSRPHPYPEHFDRAPKLSK